VGEAAGCAGSSTSLAFARACEHLGVAKVAVLASYPEPAAQAFQRFLAQSKLTVTAMRWLSISSGPKAAELGLSNLIEQASTIELGAAEALLVPDTAIPAWAAIAPLEERLRIPVLTANQVTLWEALRLTGALRRRGDWDGCSVANSEYSLTSPERKARPPPDEFHIDRRRPTIVGGRVHRHPVGAGGEFAGKIVRGLQEEKLQLDIRPMLDPANIDDAISTAREIHRCFMRIGEWQIEDLGLERLVVVGAGRQVETRHQDADVLGGALVSRMNRQSPLANSNCSLGAERESWNGFTSAPISAPRRIRKTSHIGATYATTGAKVDQRGPPSAPFTSRSKLLRLAAKDETGRRQHCSGLRHGRSEGPMAARRRSECG
jgi:hypothetical protein